MFLLSNELHPEYTAHKNVLATASAIYLKEILQAVVLIYELQFTDWSIGSGSPSNTAVSNIYKYVQGRDQAPAPAPAPAPL